VTRLAGIEGVGHALPLTRIPGGGMVDPLFYGAGERRVLAPGESVVPLVVEACRAALAGARKRPSDVDRLYGSISMSVHLTPNELFAVHHALGLRDDVLVVPLNCEFSQFIVGCSLAREALDAGRASTVLVAVGANISAHTDPRDAFSGVVSDGAGAAVIGRAPRWDIVDLAVRTVSHTFDAMNLKAGATYEIREAGLEVFRSEGISALPMLAAGLCSRHEVAREDLTVIGHEASRYLTDAWAKAIGPAAYFREIERHGNLPGASVPVTLSMHLDEVTTNHVVLLSPGTGIHFAALLLRRATDHRHWRS
jgi:3-oxoacyl-[acyl-carrier-protein] synthase-3